MKSSSARRRRAPIPRSAPPARSTPSGARCLSRFLTTRFWTMCSSRCASSVKGTGWCSSRGALAHDSAAPTARQEFVRKARTIAGTFQLFARERWLLTRGTTGSGSKRCHTRRCVWRCRCCTWRCLRIGVALATEWLYGWALIGQMAFYAAALGGLLPSASDARSCSPSPARCACSSGRPSSASSGSPRSVSRSRGNAPSGLTSPARDRALGPPHSVSNARHHRVGGRRLHLCRCGRAGQCRHLLWLHWL